MLVFPILITINNYQDEETRLSNKMKVLFSSFLTVLASSLWVQQSNAFTFIVSSTPTKAQQQQTITATTTTLLAGTSSSNQNTPSQSSLVESRRSAIKNIFVGGAVMMTTTTSILSSNPLIANADVTAKVASTAALRIVKRSLKELQNVELLAVENDYGAVKQSLRVPPFTELRKNCSTLINGGSDGPEKENLESLYGQFIKSIEALDSACSLGIRGRKGVELLPLFDEASKSLSAFYDVAKKAAEIPVQYEESNGEAVEQS